MSWKEDRIHLWLARSARPRNLSGSRGHDAAVLRTLARNPVVCVDHTVAGVHFEEGASARAVGRKAVGRALSDLAATAATPRAVLCALRAPRDADERWIKALMTSVRSTARAHGADLVGGDLCAARGALGVSITAIGELASDLRPPGRDRARAGEHVVLTGAVGGSALGRHLQIEPRIREGQWLHAAGVNAMMDVSDGLAWDAFRLARASGVRIELELDRVPIHADARRAAARSGKSAIWHALHDGEDHELLATCSPALLARVMGDARAHAARARAGAGASERPRGVAVIGRVLSGSGLLLVESGARPRRWRASEGAYEHGG